MGKNGGKQQCCQQASSARHRQQRRNASNHPLPPRSTPTYRLPSQPGQGFVSSRPEPTAILNRAIQASLLPRPVLARPELPLQVNLQPSGQHQDDGTTTFRAEIASHDARLQMLEAQAAHDARRQMIEAQAAIERNLTPHRTAPARGPRSWSSWSFQYLADHSICLSWLATGVEQAQRNSESFWLPTGEEQSQRSTPHHFFNPDAFPSLVRALEAVFPSTAPPRE